MGIPLIAPVCELIVSPTGRPDTLQAYGNFAGLYPALKRQKIFNVDLDCILLSPREKGSGDLRVGAVPSYCLSRNGATLIASEDENQTTAFVALQPMKIPPEV